MKQKKRKAELYKKVMNRPMSLILVQCWYLGERFGLSKITEGVMFFEPIFISREGKGVEVYYNFSSKQQQPEALCGYFQKNIQKFKKLAEEYEKYNKKILELTKENKEKNFEKVFSLMVKLWPMVVASNLIGREKFSGNGKKLIKLAYGLRVQYDKVAYDAEKYLLKMVQRKMPPEYREAASLLFPEEIISEKIPSQKILDARKKGYMYLEGKLSIGDNIENFCRKHSIIIEQENKSNKRNVLHGMTAQKGKAIGSAIVVFEKNQMGKVQKGDILIAPMTTPDFIPAIKRAAAIVTDEGGITCHAAIVAREMKKPCVIGTKIATKVLTDGDLVEVDAEKGIVRILKKTL